MGLRMMNRHALEQAGLSAFDAIALAHDWYQVCYAAQEASDWLQIHSMASCQTIMWVGIARARVVSSFTDLCVFLPSVLPAHTLHQCIEENKLGLPSDLQSVSRRVSVCIAWTGNLRNSTGTWPSPNLAISGAHGSIVKSEGVFGVR